MRLYGTGMRLLKGLRLRVQDVDFSYRRIHDLHARAQSPWCRGVQSTGSIA